MLLVARRDLLSPAFTESVVLLLRHDARGTLGVIINRRTRFRLHDLLPDLKGSRDVKYPVLIGGPVAPHGLLLLLRDHKPVPGIERVTGDLGFSAELDVLEALIARHKPAADARLYIGHAGWAAGQLDFELARGSWFVVKATADAVFTDDEDTLWQRLIDRLDPPGIRVRRPAPFLGGVAQTGILTADKVTVAARSSMRHTEWPDPRSPACRDS
jgi:putative transcriptional regulator